MMKAKNKILALLTLCFSFGAMAQSNSNLNSMSYDQMEQRFTKKQLNSEDSLAFKTQSIQKAKLLLEYAHLYTNNSNSDESKNLVKQKAQALFRANTQTGALTQIDMDFILNELHKISLTNPETQVPIVFKQHNKSFGILEIGAPYGLVTKVYLLKQDKSYGSNSLSVWQVYLDQPVFEQKKIQVKSNSKN